MVLDHFLEQLFSAVPQYNSDDLVGLLGIEVLWGGLRLLWQIWRANSGAKQNQVKGATRSSRKAERTKCMCMVNMEN
jgi:hypothetical protein